MPLPLGKLVLFSSVVASGSCALIQKAFSRASFYQLALEQLHNHPEVLVALYTSLNVYYLHFINKYNFVDIANA